MIRTTINHLVLQILDRLFVFGKNEVTDFKFGTSIDNSKSFNDRPFQAGRGRHHISRDPLLGRIAVVRRYGLLL